jgi:L-aminopeptidase/D-esterase-like protein
MLGMASAMKGGLGTSSIRIGSLVVGAMAAVNCAGDVVDPSSGEIVAGARNEDGSFADMRKVVRSGRRARAREGNNTTLGIVATNASFTKTEMTKVAQMAQDALARTIYPAHTPGDGDTVFALSTGTSEADANLGTVGALAAEALAEAILRGVKRATSLPGYPAYDDVQD